MRHSDPRRNRRPGWPFDLCLSQVSCRVPASVLAVGLTFATAALAGQAARVPGQTFKMANVHFETNASACDMGIQIIFDTEGITRGLVKDPGGRRIYSFQSAGGMKAIGGQTEGFLEGVEPQITELLELETLGCEPSDEEEEIPRGALRSVSRRRLHIRG